MPAAVAIIHPSPSALNAALVLILASVTGAISRRVAAGVAIVGGVVGLTISAAFGATVLAVGIVGYGSGVAYDVRMRRLGLWWLCFAIAFPALLAWTWLAAAGQLPLAWRARRSISPAT